MIWGIIAVIGGLILRARAVVLIPLVYLLARKNKDLGLIAYFFYAVALMNDVFVRDVLSFETANSRPVINEKNKNRALPPTVTMGKRLK